jgi:ATP-binding cassette subfamily C protein
LVDHYRHQAFSALLGAEWRWLAQSRRNDHANLLLSDVDRIGLGLQLGLNLMATTATVVIYLLVALVLSPAIAIFAIVNGAAVFWLLSSQRRRALDLGYRQTKTGRALHANVHESLAGIKLAKLLGSEGRHLALFEEDMRNLRAQYLAALRSSHLSRALFQVGAAGLLVLYLYVGLTYAKMPVAQLLALTLLFSRLVPSVMSVQQLMYHWSHAMPALVSAEELLRDCAAAAEPPRITTPQPWPLSEGIRLEAVNCTYPGRDRPALADVNLWLPVRTTTAIVGASGSGKSTLADMLIGLLVPDGGSVVVDGIPLQGEARMRWRQSVSYVPQEPFLFHDSIRNNLLWGRPGAHDSEIADALSRAAADFVLDLPEGCATIVGDAGMRLSGGERQRIALARALLQNPSLLILDEATSALDVENELRIRDALERLHGDLTVVIIGHRLATLEHADQVVRLDHGRVAACGRWSEVSAAGGTDS